MRKPITPSKRSRKASPGQGLVEFALALPVLLLLIFGLIEFALIFTAWMMVENSARTAARYAVTGQFNTTYCSQFGSATTDPMAGASCDLTLNRDELGVQHWQYGPETPAELCAKIFKGPPLPAVCEYNSDMTYEDVVGAMQDAARLDSIRDVAISGAPSLLMDGATSDETARGWFHTEICSSRRYMDPDPPKSSSYRPAYVWNAPECTRLDYDGSHLGRENDAGGPGDQITINVLFNHPLITPIRGVAGNAGNWIRLTALRTMVVERFRTSRVFGLPPLVALFTPTPSDTPTPLPPTDTPTPTITPTPTDTPTPTLTPTPTNTPTPSCDQLSMDDLGMKDKKLVTTIRNSGPYALTVARVSLGWPTGQFPAGSGAAYMNAMQWNGADLAPRSTGSPVTANNLDLIMNSNSDANFTASFDNFGAVTVPGPGGAVTIGSSTSMAQNFVNGADFSLSVELRFASGLVCTLTANGHHRPTVTITQPPSGTITGRFTIQATATDADSGVRNVFFYVYNSSNTRVHNHRETLVPYCGWSDNNSGGACYNAIPWGSGKSNPFGYWLIDSNQFTYRIVNGSYLLVTLVQDKDATFPNSEDSWQYAYLPLNINAPTPTPTRTPTPRPPATYTPTSTATWDRTKPTYTWTPKPPTRTPKPTVPTRTSTPKPPATYTYTPTPGPAPTQPPPTPTQVD